MIGHADVVSAFPKSYTGSVVENRWTCRRFVIFEGNSRESLDRSVPERDRGNYYGAMNSSAKEPSANRLQQTPRSARVVSWPLRDGGFRAWAMLMGLGLIASGAGFIAASALMGGGCFAALAVAAWRLWVPVTFEFRSRGVIYTVLGRARQIPWTQIARYEVRPRGLLLFAEADTSPLAALRSVYIPWNGQRAAILEVVGFYTTMRVSVASTKTFTKETTENSEA